MEITVGLPGGQPGNHDSNGERILAVKVTYGDQTVVVCSGDVAMLIVPDDATLTVVAES